MKWFLLVLGALALLAVAGLIYVRVASHDAARWHVDPTTVTEIDDLNQYLAGDAVPGDLETVADALKAALGGEMLAGSFAEGFATVVVRTPLIGYPDYVSAGLIAQGDQTQVVLFSRSRFGKSDLGANKARVDGVIRQLQADLDTGS